MNARVAARLTKIALSKIEYIECHSHTAGRNMQPWAELTATEIKLLAAAGWQTQGYEASKADWQAREAAAGRIFTVRFHLTKKAAE